MPGRKRRNEDARRLVEERQRAPRRDVSDQRKVTYLVGNVMAGLGLVLFLSVFASAACSTHHDPFLVSHAQASMFGRAVGGMVLIIVGRLVRNIGARGVAGSGVILDPVQAREDLEPFARQAGGLFGDAVDESRVLDSLGSVSKGDAGRLDFDEALRKLHKLHEDGILSEEEYLREKQGILDRL